VAPSICGSSVRNLNLLPFWCLETWGGCKIFGKFVHPWWNI